jgi:type IV secretion system protein VirB1
MFSVLASSLKLSIIIPVAYAALLSHCAPRVGQETMSALVSYESGWHPWAIDDNVTHRSYFPATKSQAVALASSLVGQGDPVEMGLSQIDSQNLRSLGLSVNQIFDPCTNLSAGARILEGNYYRARREFGPGTVALFHALEAYNTNRLNGNPRYAMGVFQQASSSVDLHIPRASFAVVYQPPALPQMYSLLQGGRAVTVRSFAPTVLTWERPRLPRALPLTGVNVFLHPDRVTGSVWGAFPKSKFRN